MNTLSISLSTTHDISPLPPSVREVFIVSTFTTLSSFFWKNNIPFTGNYRYWHMSHSREWLYCKYSVTSFYWEESIWVDYCVQRRVLNSNHVKRCCAHVFENFTHFLFGGKNIYRYKGTNTYEWGVVWDTTGSDYVVSIRFTRFTGTKVHTPTHLLVPMPWICLRAAPRVRCPPRDDASSYNGRTSLRSKPAARRSDELTIIATGVCEASVSADGSHSSKVRPETSSSTRWSHTSTTRA